ncbi:MAG TPA: GlsB/YeaQ/YmgE family stress response membrane protein [Burkholderiales bacterium]|nr:GlsB/YeaQ/YmgE family stress response membrane protein [Burkholderiales bacterium]
MELIWTILIGFVAGVVAKLLRPGTGPSGFFLTAALGIGGAIVATFLGRALGLYHAGEGAGFIGATIGAVILLVLYHFIAKKPPP